jgi:hypothetical protein
MKKFLFLIALLGFQSCFSQKTIEVSLTQVSKFSVYGKDSIHKMISKTNLSPYKEIYKPINLKLVINKKTKEVHRYKDGSLTDVIPIKKIEFKDSIYTITVVEKRDEGWSHYKGQMIDCYLVLGMRKNPINKKQPTFV